MRIESPLFLTDEDWVLASQKREAGREAEWIIGSALAGDIKTGRVNGASTCIAVLADIANYYPERVAQVPAALATVLKVFQERNGLEPTEIAKQLATNFDSCFLKEFRAPGVKLSEQDTQRFQRQQQIYDVLSELSKPVGSP